MVPDPDLPGAGMVPDPDLPGAETVPDPGAPVPPGAAVPIQSMAEPDPPLSGPPVGEATPSADEVRRAVHSPPFHSSSAHSSPVRGSSATPGATPAGPLAPVERLEGRLEALRREGRAALVAYGVAGYPDLDGSLAAFRAMAEAGADVLEVGPPYSDPLIDGPVIQRAVTAALDAGTRLDDVFGLVNELTASVDAPVVLLVYYNLVAHRGPRRFAAELAAAGACGAVVPDLPPEEAGEWLEAARAAGVAPVFLAAPTSTDARLAAIAKAGRGFVYAQASLGVTGLRASLAAGIEELVGRVRGHTDLPVCAGIGVSNAEQAAAVAALADGAVVGTALVNRLANAGLDGLRALTAELADAVHSARP
jgi:tryptophan synthase alpha chain